jgi:hypothetical protein
MRLEAAAQPSSRLNGSFPAPGRLNQPYATNYCLRLNDNYAAVADLRRG